MSLGIGFVAGALVVAIFVFLISPGRLKSISVGKEGLKIEGRDSAVFFEDRSSAAKTEIEMTVSGRWLTKLDRPAIRGQGGSRFGSIQEGTPVPAKLSLRPGELYKFVADAGFSDEDLRKLGKFSRHAQLRYLGFHKCIHLSAAGIGELSKFWHLWDIDLSYTKVDSAALMQLVSLKALKQIDLRACNNVTNLEIDNFSRALPNCKVVR